MAKIYGALEVAQLEWFTNAGKPAASSYPYRVIYVTDLKQIQVSDGTNWLPSNVTSYTSGTLPAASSANQYQVAFLTDTLQLRISDGTKWTTVGARLDTYTSGTIPAAASNTNQMIWVSDLQQVQVSNGTSWVQVGSKAGTKNYFTQSNANPDFETNSVSPWSACTLTFSGSAPTGAPTLTATQMAISTTGTTPLAGTYSMLCTKSAANAQYQGFISGVLTIDREDVAKVMYGSFNYEVNSGTVDMSGTSTQTYEIWIYNVVGNQWIQPAGFRGMNQSAGPGKVVFSFQTDGSFANNQYRVAVITQQTSTAASVVEFDDFAVGPTAISVVQLRNPAGTIIATGSLTPPSGYLYCDGTAISRTDYAELFAAIGTTYGIGNGTTTFNIPDLRGIFARGAGTNPSNASNTTTIGARQLDDFKSHVHTSTPIQVGGGTFTSTGNYLGQNGSPVAGPGTQATGGTETRPANVGVAYHICFSSGYVQMSNDTDTRIVDFRAYTTSARTMNNTAPTIIFENVDKDSHGAYNAATGVYTIPVSGDYVVSGQMRVGSLTMTAGAFFGFSAKVNGTYSVRNHYTSFRTPVASAAGAYAEGSGSVLLTNLTAGQTITIGGWADNATATFTDGANTVCIQRVSGPSVIAANETVAVWAYKTSGSHTTNGLWQTVSAYTTKVIDTHSAFNATTGIFTAPISGTFHISGTVAWSANVTGARGGKFVTSSVTSQIGLGSYFTGNNGTANLLIHTVSSLIKLNAGETVNLEGYQVSGGNLAYSTATDAATQISIIRVGN